MSRHERRKGLRNVKREDGPAARHDERVRLRAARDLATALAKAHGADSEIVEQARAAVAHTEPT